LIDHESLLNLLGADGLGELRKPWIDWVEETLKPESLARTPKWSESIAVGDEAFVRDARERLGIRAACRNVWRRQAGLLSCASLTSRTSLVLPPKLAF